MAGPFPIETYSGYRYFVTFIDEHTRFCFVYPIKTRSDLYKVYEQFMTDVKESHNCRVDLLCHSVPLYDTDVSGLHADNAREYQALANLIGPKYGTKTRFSHAYHPAQNGIAERRMRTIMEKVRALLLDGHLPNQLWGEAVVTVNDVCNCLPSTVLDGDTPYRAWHGYEFNVRRLKVFGCAAYAHIPKEFVVTCDYGMRPFRVHVWFVV